MRSCYEAVGPIGPHFFVILWLVARFENEAQLGPIWDYGYWDDYFPCKHNAQSHTKMADGSVDHAIHPRVNSIFVRHGAMKQRFPFNFEFHEPYLGL